MAAQALPGPRSTAAWARLRVLVVDDSFVVRELMSRWIGAEPGLEVVGTAKNGRDALRLVDELRPDIVLLDLEMPDGDGLTVLPGLLARRPDLSVVIVSTLTQRNAELSLRCLALGAVDYVPKPTTRGSSAGSLDFRGELLAKLSSLAGRHGGDRAAIRLPPRSEPRETRVTASARKARLVVIGASTGGPRAITNVLLGLAEVSRQVPILLLQHMPAVFTAAFARSVADETGLAVAEAENGEPLRPGRVYVAPGGRHLGLFAPSGTPLARLVEGPAVQHCRPSLDILFADAARLFGPGCLGVVLTGMGSDGTEGAKAVVQAGGTILAQDEGTSIVWGMPGSIVRHGLARAVLPIGSIAGAVADLVGGRVA